MARRKYPTADQARQAARRIEARKREEERAKQGRFRVYSGEDPETGAGVVVVEIGDRRVLLSPGQAWSFAARIRRAAISIGGEGREKRGRAKERAGLLEGLARDILRRDDLRLLGLAPGCTAADVKPAYRRRVLETHPDRGGSEEEFRRVHAAYRRVAGLDGGRIGPAPWPDR